MWKRREKRVEEIEQKEAPKIGKEDTRVEKNQDNRNQSPKYALRA